MTTLAGLSSFITAAVTAASDLNTATDELFSASEATHTDGLRDSAAMSGFVANVLRPGALADLEAASRVERVLAERSFSMVYQPIVDAHDGHVVVTEALSRFTPEPYRSPDVWFADAWRAGFGAELELAAFAAALADLDALPTGVRLAINLSPTVITNPRLSALLAPIDPQRIVIELTEHVAIADYPRVRDALAGLRAGGVRLAIDDAGAGFSSFSHIIKLSPDIVKLDRELIAGIDADPVRQSLARAIVTFAADIGADIVAEGVETKRELDVIGTLGIRLAQGILIGSPGPVEALGGVIALDHIFAKRPA